MAATERDRVPESELARRFRQHVLADVDYLKSRGYNPTRFLGMIAQNKSVVTVAKCSLPTHALSPKVRCSASCA
jgi:hypothetical protein